MEMRDLGERQSHWGEKKKKDKTLWIHCMKRQGIMQKDREVEGSGNRKWGKGPWVLVEREKTSGSVKKGTDWKRLERK